MDNKVSIVYIDDKIDNSLSKYLDRFEYEDFEYSTTELQFEDRHTDFTVLLEEQAVAEADIVIIDSKLFEEGNVTEKFSGEEFKIIFKAAHPFSKIFVMSQNEGSDSLGTIKKYDSRNIIEKPAEVYYNEVLKTKISSASCEILQRRRIFNKLKHNTEFYKGSTIVEKIDSMMEGSPRFKDLTDDKIDELISLVENTIKPQILD